MRSSYGKPCACNLSWQSQEADEAISSLACGIAPIKEWDRFTMTFSQKDAELIMTLPEGRTCPVFFAGVISVLSFCMVDIVRAAYIHE